MKPIWAPQYESWTYCSLDDFEAVAHPRQSPPDSGWTSVSWTFASGNRVSRIYAGIRPEFEVLDALVNLETRRLTYGLMMDTLSHHPDLVGLYCIGGGMEGVLKR